MIFDDGYFYGDFEDVIKFWEIIKEKRPTIGYHPNSKSMIFDLNPENKSEWERLGLSFSSEGLEVLGSPIGSDRFTKNFALEKFNKIAKMIDQLRELAKTHPQQAFAVLNRIPFAQKS